MRELQPIETQVLTFKRNIHEMPEQGWQEVRTTGYIVNNLAAASLINGLGPNNTGAVFVLGGGNESIFLRADIDALNTSIGPQHICGHSTHTAALMGAYFWLREHEHELTARKKSVTFLFQPAEEAFPPGAKTFLETYPEILPKSKFGFGIHVRPSIPVGSIQIDDEATWAANDLVEVTVQGRAAHIKDTLRGIDAIDGATKIVQLFKRFQGAFPDFGTSIVFNFNVIRGGVKSNTIADTVVLRGGVRWLRKVDQQRVIDFFNDLPHVLAKEYLGTVSVEYTREVPPVCMNDSALAEEVARYMENLSEFRIIRNGDVSLGSEDFAYFTKQNRTLFTHIGTGSPYDLHDQRMEVSDEATLNVYHYWRNLLQWWINKSLEE
jgi:amidohydrolase